jgi:cell division protein FtsZ
MAFEYDAIPGPQPRIKVVGVGGGGTNAVNRMIHEGLEGVEFIALSTNAVKLRLSQAHIRILLGEKLTRGLGAGARPEVGARAFEESRDAVRKALEGADLVFITAGMGGGTATGAVSLVAELAREMGALTIAVVTKPFLFEGKKRMKQAEQGLAELKRATDTMIVVPNERLLAILPRGTSFSDALRKVDEVLLHAVQGISDLIRVTGEVNVDFADVRTVLSNRGAAVLGTGVGRGGNRAVEAAEQALSSELLDNISIGGAAGVLINITGGMDLNINEVTTISSIIQDAAGDDAEIIFGAVNDPSLGDEVRVTVIATGFAPAPGVVMRAEPVRVVGPAVQLVSEPASEPASERAPEPAFVIAWDPEVVDPDVYAEVVEILGELTRLEGGKGIARIRSRGFGVPALDEVFA